MDIRKSATILSRSLRSHSVVPCWMLLKPSDAPSATSRCQVLQQQHQRRQLASMILITKIRSYNNNMFFPATKLLRKKATVTYDPWEPPKPTRGGPAFGETDAAGSPYSRHPDDTDTNNNDGIDVEEINRLINERNNARRSRDFDIANRVVTQLKSEYGVVLNDQERTWSTNPANMGRFKPLNNTSTEDFGPTGHDYKLLEKAGKSITQLHEDFIHSLIAERLQCKKNRNFDRADAIQQQLNDAHVQLDDGNKLWRPDGKRFASGVYDYSYASEAGPIITTMPVEQIKASLRERLACRFNRDFVTADRIRGELQAVGVYIEDDNRLWRGDGIPFPKRIHNPREGYDEA